MAKRNYNGEGTVYYSAKLDRFVAQFTDPNTKKRKSIYAKTEKEARKKLRDALNKSENGAYLDKNNVTIPEIAKNIVDSKYNANIIGDSTYLRSKETIRIIEKNDIALLPIQSITKNDLQDFLNSITGYSKSSIHKVYILINNCYKVAIEDGIVIKNPLESVLKPKSKKATKKVEALTLEQHKTFINSLDKEPYKDIFLIAINTGIRVGELLALTPDDIDFKNKVINISRTITRTETDFFRIKDSTKTYAGTRSIPFDAQLEEILKDAISKQEPNPCNLIFTYNKSIIRPSSLNTVFKRICKNLGFDGSFNFHMLRHTFATRCIEAGMPAHVLQKLLGHTDVSTTINTYTSIFDKYKEDEYKKYLKYKKKHNI